MNKRDLRREIYLPNTPLITKTNSTDEHILLTFTNVADKPIKLHVQIEQVMDFAAMPYIVTGVCVLVLLLIGIGCWVLRHTRSRILENGLIFSNELSDKELRQYFPECQLAVIENSQNSSALQISNSTEEQ